MPGAGESAAIRVSTSAAARRHVAEAAAERVAVGAATGVAGICAAAVQAQTQQEHRCCAVGATPGVY